jgi:hypothetical protein
LWKARLGPTQQMKFINTEIRALLTHDTLPLFRGEVRGIRVGNPLEPLPRVYGALSRTWKLYLQSLRIIPLE